MLICETAPLTYITFAQPCEHLKQPHRASPSRTCNKRKVWLLACFHTKNQVHFCFFPLQTLVLWSLGGLPPDQCDFTILIFPVQQYSNVCPESVKIFCKYVSPIVHEDIGTAELNGLSLVHTVKCRTWAWLFCLNVQRLCRGLLTLLCRSLA